MPKPINPFAALGTKNIRPPNTENKAEQPQRSNGNAPPSEPDEDTVDAMVDALDSSASLQDAIANPSRPVLPARSNAPLLTEPQAVIVEQLYLEENMDARDIAPRLGVTPEQLHRWLSNRGLPEKRKKIYGMAADRARKLAGEIAAESAALLSDVVTKGLKEAQKDVDQLATTTDPKERYMIARTVSTLVGMVRVQVAGGQVNGPTFNFAFMQSNPLVKRAIPVSIPVSSESVPGADG